MPEALPELVWFAVLLFCFAFVWVARKLIAALFKPVFSIVPNLPYVGTALDSFLHSIEQGVDNALGSVESGIDSLMGASWHRFAELNELLWRELKRHTLIGQLTADLVAKLTHVYEHLHGIAHHALAVAESIPHSVKRLEREYRGIEHKLRYIDRHLFHGIGHDILPRLGSLEHDLSHLERRTIPAIRAADRQADAAINDLYSWARGKASLLGVGTITTAVATALAALGLDWIKCREAQNLYNKRGCGMWSDLDGLLALFAAGLAVEDYRDLVKLAQSLEHDAAVGIQDLLSV